MKKSVGLMLIVLLLGCFGKTGYVGDVIGFPKFGRECRTIMRHTDGSNMVNGAFAVHDSIGYKEWRSIVLRSNPDTCACHFPVLDFEEVTLIILCYKTPSCDEEKYRTDVQIDRKKKRCIISSKVRGNDGCFGEKVGVSEILIPAIPKDFEMKFIQK